MINFVLFYTFFLVGLFSFGGGAGMMALIEQEVCTRHAWMTVEELYQYIGIAESTPGPIAVNIATAVGFYQSGVLGAICATLGVVLPSFIIILIIARFFNKLIANNYVKAILEGVKSVVLGLLVVMVIKIVWTNIFTNFGYEMPIAFNLKPFIITLIDLALYLVVFKVFKKKLPPILIILFSICLGIVFYL